MKETALTFSGASCPPWSGRGCTQTLQPLVSGALRRTVNGDLIHIGLPGTALKYRTTIRGKDQRPVALENIPLGAELTVGCISILSRYVEPSEVKESTQTKQGGSEVRIRLAHDAVLGSVYGVGETGQRFRPLSHDERTVLFKTELEKFSIFYRPQLKMRLCDFGYETDEWEMITGWFMRLEQV